MLAQMRTDIHLLGTSLRLHKGQVVEVIPASNLPKTSPIKWWARPWGGKWSDGIDRADDDSIGVEDSDLLFS